MFWVYTLFISHMYQNVEAIYDICTYRQGVVSVCCRIQIILANGLNYSSKTKLIPWDTLKLKVMPDGKFIYKLIKPADRKHLRAILSRSDDNKFTAVTDEGTVYFLNQAAVTFFKWTPGDELYIIINEKDKGSFAAIEAIIKK